MPGRDRTVPAASRANNFAMARTLEEITEHRLRPISGRGNSATATRLPGARIISRNVPARNISAVACVNICMAPALPKPHKDRGTEGLVAKWYTTNTGKTLDEFTKLARRIADPLPHGSTVLEVAPGPGYFLHRTRKARAALHHRPGHQPHLRRHREQESHRGGRGLIIDLRKDASVESINLEVDGMGLTAGASEFSKRRPPGSGYRVRSSSVEVAG
jgi:hypothetical protein